MRGIIIFITAVFSIPAAFADVIYNEQTYDYEETDNGFSIWGEGGYEMADDFEVECCWNLEMVRVWLFYSGEQDIRVDIFSNGADDKPGAPPPGDLYYEEVPAESIKWKDTGDSMFGYPIYQLDIPIEGFYIETGIRYWLGLQSITGNNSYWLGFVNSDTYWWKGACFYYNGAWYNGDYIFERYDCEFELHGTPDDSGVNARSLGGIKALYR
jgi:hypothetical protein